jgi:release factor glutamine methyltransferase
MTIVSEALTFGIQQLQGPQNSDSRLEAQLLLAHTLERDRSWLYAWPEYELNEEQERSYLGLLSRRAKGIPIAYITGEREFWSLPFKVTEDTLIPRPETELIVATVLQLADHDQSISLLDLGTGSGAIAITLASEHPSWSITATDASRKALTVAETNARQLGTPHIHFVQGDWFDPLEKNSKFHIIVSNPPYVAEHDAHLQSGDLRYEPPGALSSGLDGLRDLRQIIAQAPAMLHAGGWLLVEHGMDQAGSARKLFQDADFCEISSKTDLAHRERITMGCWR